MTNASASLDSCLSSSTRWRILRLPPERPPRVVLFDRDCTFTLTPSPRGVLAGVQREIDLFFRAAEESPAERRRSLIAAALAARAQRTATYFRGGDSALATIEARFIDLEGVAQFAALAYIRDHPKRGETAAQAVARVRNNKKWWSQEYGLALYLATNAVATDWQREVFPPTLRSAFDVIGRVSAARDRNSRH